MTATLHIARGLDLPTDAVTQPFGIIARRGAGKTYTGAVLVEEMVKASLPVVVIDPLGAWWGLRAAANGRDDGLPVTILGGEHGDLPLESTAGKVVADLVIEQPASIVLDLSAFESNAEQDRFVADFAERLYRAKAKDRRPLHVMVDEADSFAPQRPLPGQQRMLGAFESIVRRGRIRGLGVTLITQRPAVLNKNVLTQIECLVVLQLTGPQDRDAVDEWVKGNGTKEQRATFLESLASLDVGEAWFWSPSWLRTFKRVKVRRRETFDSSKTPEAGEQPVEPRKLAAVDLDVLRTKMAATIDRAKADDPKLLRKRIVELERDLAKKLGERLAPAPERIVERVEIPVVPAELVEQIHALRADASKLIGLSLDFAGFAERALGELERAAHAAPPTPAVQPPAPATRRSAARPTSERSVVPVGDAPLGKAQRAFLTVLAQHPDGRTNSQIAMQSGYSKRSSHFASTLSSLRVAGYANTGSGRTRITDDGIAALGDYDPLPTGAALIDYWRAELGDGAAGKFFDVIVDAHPGAVTQADLAARTGYSRGSSHFASSISKLRTLDLVSGRGELRASDDLFTT